MHIPAAFLMACILAVGGCIQMTDNARPAALDDDVRIARGATVAFADGGLAVTFRDVIDDSRCPSDVVCVWRGVAVIGFDVTVDRREAQRITLADADGAGHPSEAMVEGYRIRLIQVDPYPQTNQPIPPETYSAVIRVSRQ